MHSNIHVYGKNAGNKILKNSYLHFENLKQNLKQDIIFNPFDTE